jgi:transposase
MPRAGGRSATRTAASPPAFLADRLQNRPQALAIFEATGRYDRHLRVVFDELGVAYARVNPSRARDFARAAGYLAKTDAVDARMLAAKVSACRSP